MESSNVTVTSTPISSSTSTFTTTAASNQTSSTTTTTTTTSTSAETAKTTTKSSTTSAKVSTPTTPKAPINPDDRSGSKFDGWSFFGGILLTVGVSAIGFISFKYYKVRSSHQGGANYNRF